MTSTTIPSLGLSAFTHRHVAGRQSVYTGASNFTITEEQSPMTYYGAKDLADSLRTVRKNTLIIAEEIPEDRYGFRAAPETRTVA